MAEGFITRRGRPIVGKKFAQFSWDEDTTDPFSVNPSSPSEYVMTNLYNKMRGCVLNPDRSVNYYLDEDDWAYKANGTPSDLTGADGNVMVEIPKYYFNEEKVGTVTTWTISHLPITGLTLHPGFILDGQQEDKRYYSAYDACVKKADGSFIGGLNLDNNTGRVSTSADQLASVKGQYPMVGLTRNEFRLLAANVGAKWRQLDYPLVSSVQMLYVVEFQSFYSQQITGNGNSNNTYLASSANQNQSPHTIAGFRDDVGNKSTTSGNAEGAATKPGTIAMKYRGIENLYGNCWNWADGININVGATGNVHIITDNIRANYADDISTNYTLVGTGMPTGSAVNIRNLIANTGGHFLTRTTGGTNAQYITDSLWMTTGLRVVIVGGSASNGSLNGVFTFNAEAAFSFRLRNLGSRLSC